MTILQEFNKIVDVLRSLPKIWNGKKSILEMKHAHYNQWRQTEWMGFYFQFLCEEHLKIKNVLEIPGPKYDNVKIDALGRFPWDFKAHAINTSAHQIIVNDKKAIAKAIKDYKKVGVVLALGEVEYNDAKRNFQKWHEKLKGGLSKYSKERIKRGAWSRLRKVEFNLKQICFISIDNKTLKSAGLFQKDFRNANGSLRNEKILIDLEKLDKEIIKIIDFV